MMTSLPENMSQLEDEMQSDRGSAPPRLSVQCLYICILSVAFPTSFHFEAKSDVHNDIATPKKRTITGLPHILNFGLELLKYL